MPFLNNLVRVFTILINAFKGVSFSSFEICRSVAFLYKSSSDAFDPCDWVLQKLKLKNTNEL